MTEDEAYKVHIQYTFNAFCKVVIRHAATANPTMIEPALRRRLLLATMIKMIPTNASSGEKDSGFSNRTHTVSLRPFQVLCKLKKLI